MRRLGYTRYVAQGGDLGAFVADEMARQAPAGLLGIHLNLLKVALLGPPPAEPTEQERAALAAIATMQTSGYGYFLEQATRPQTIGYALVDAPVALAAWMLDHDTDSYYKISRAFLDKQPSGHLTRDSIVDNITLYWLTGTGASAAREYWENGQAAGPCQPDRPLRRSPSQSASRYFPARSSEPRALGPSGLPHPHLLPRGRQGRPFRRLGRARTVRNRDPGGVPVPSIKGSARTIPHSLVDSHKERNPSD